MITTARAGGTGVASKPLRACAGLIALMWALSPLAQAEQATSQVDWRAAAHGGFADEAPGPSGDSGTGPQGAGWSAFHYVHIAGTNFLPRDSSTTWSYPGTGCVSMASGSSLFTVHLNVPAGSRIDYLRIFYFDTSASNGTGWISYYDGAGNFVDLTNASTTGDAGYGTVLSPLVEHVVNTLGFSYVLNWQPIQTGSTMRLCGMRVAYRLPI